MKELEFRTSSEDSTATDLRDFDEYATQFVNSLIETANEEQNYWHGRLIGFGHDGGNPGAWSPYTINFLGNELNENLFRKQLKDQKIDIKKFDILSEPPLQYRSEKSSPKHVDAHLITYRAALTYTVDGGADQTLIVELTHHIRRTYMSYRTEIKRIQ